MWLHVFFFIFFINTFVHPSCVRDDQRQKNWEEKLTKAILCSNIREPPNKNLTTVVAHFRLKTFNYEEDEELFYTYNWIFFRWTDPRLKWNPVDYDGINQIIVHPMDIWTPIRHVKNLKSIDEDTDNFSFSLFCQISSDGTVSCIPRVLQATVCTTNLKNWPYDVQNCTFIFGFGRGGKNDVFLTFNSTRGISALGAEYGNGWDIVNFESREIHNKNTELHLTYIVERRALGLVCMIVIPAVIIIVLTMTSLFLDVRDNNRLYFLVFSLLSHFYFLQAISENLPHHGPDTPRILIFIRSSIFVTVTAILLTLILKTLRKNTVSPPLWVIITTDYVSKNCLRYLIFVTYQDETNDFSENTANRNWSYFVSIVNAIFIYSFFVTYQILFIQYIPKPWTALT
ncbi:acetylcholine receptor subunit beta-type unc-29-like [Danaus plexippus]|uniref:acetylcholine receptor subunit beta-type unc-29-like n=1 Tax=Danaus plexippus TaxID=13037 RepID=UPI002AAFDB30|nr:acetylcholine receptor subunit beta-type unc-29-like [Danaus plexippus]